MATRRTCPACKGRKLIRDVPNAQKEFTALLPPGFDPRASILRCRECLGAGHILADPMTGKTRPGVLDRIDL